MLDIQVYIDIDYRAVTSLFGTGVQGPYKLLTIWGNWENLHTFGIKNKTIFYFKLTAILKIQSSLSLRGLHFLIALKNWF